MMPELVLSCSSEKIDCFGNFPGNIILPEESFAVAEDAAKWASFINCLTLNDKNEHLLAAANDMKRHQQQTLKLHMSQKIPSYRRLLETIENVLG